MSNKSESLTSKNIAYYDSCTLCTTLTKPVCTRRVKTLCKHDLNPWPLVLITRPDKQVQCMQGKVSRHSSYNPLDLYSTDPARMQHPLQALLACPQNNLKLFLDGRPVPLSDDASCMHQIAAAVHQAFQPSLDCNALGTSNEVLASLLQQVLSRTGRAAAWPPPPCHPIAWFHIVSIAWNGTDQESMSLFYWELHSSQGGCCNALPAVTIGAFCAFENAPSRCFAMVC